MKIVPVDYSGPHRTGSLKDLKVKDVVKVLGFKANCDDDESKVKYSFGFEVDGVHCAIWDYKGSAKYGDWSTFGPKEIFVKLFGAEHVE